VTKKICFTCQKAFGIPDRLATDSEFKCPRCSGQAFLLTHRFRPPKASDNKKWQVIRFLFENGFRFQHISNYEADHHGILRFSNFVKYPENMIDALEFVEIYKDQALK
jgi:DNA-directed RNA polymerase subunit RPC12/RpoP